jgi:hypothetical protein
MRKAPKPYGDAMIQSHEPAILDLAVISLHGAIRRIAVRLLEGTDELDVTTIRRVERLMRIALDLAGVRQRDAPDRVPFGCNSLARV